MGEEKIIVMEIVVFVLITLFTIVSAFHLAFWFGILVLSIVVGGAFLALCIALVWPVDKK